jgi:hypothetical protein
MKAYFAVALIAATLVNAESFFTAQFGDDHTKFNKVAAIPFKQFDTNNDKKLDEEEWQRAISAYKTLGFGTLSSEPKFADIDANGDNSINSTEFRVYFLNSARNSDTEKAADVMESSENINKTKLVENGHKMFSTAFQKQCDKPESEGTWPVFLACSKDRSSEECTRSMCTLSGDDLKLYTAAHRDNDEDDFINNRNNVPAPPGVSVNNVNWYDVYKNQLKTHMIIVSTLMVIFAIAAVIAVVLSVFQLGIAFLVATLVLFGFMVWDLVRLARL